MRCSSRHARLAVLLCAAVPAALSAQPVTALVGGTLIDGHGGPPVRNSVVLVRGETIQAIGTVGTLAVPAGATTISTEGMTVLPGLWDMHVHLMLAGHGNYAKWDREYPPRLGSEILPATARQTLLAGVTSVRDLGAPLDEILALKRRVDAGELPGPTIYPSGPFLQHAPYPGTEAFRWGVNGPDDARAKVRRLADAGVKVIKLIDQDEMTLDEVRAIVDEAHARRLPVVAHAHRPEEIRRGLAVGVDCFEHTGLATAPRYPDDIMAALRERSARGNIAPLYWTPTISVLDGYTGKRDDDEFLDDPAWQLGLSRATVTDIRASLARLDTLSYYRFVPSRKPWLVTKFRQLRESGVRLLIGTDGGVPATWHGSSTVEEMVAWVREFGMDPMETVRAATYWPALSLGVLDRVGTVSAGKAADLLVVRGNPLQDITRLRQVAVVLKGGRRVVP
ncbi:MAG: amidohydrolase family protein [Gemmatimonadaceae bacterium]|nr:amidohydrolase family protein [Gemmatimonadaceae bacterium]